MKISFPFFLHLPSSSLSLGLFLDFGFIFESFPSLAIWPTYCILLSTFSSVSFEDLSAFDLSIDLRNLSKIFYLLSFI